MSDMKEFLMDLWQLPQYLVAFLYYLYLLFSNKIIYEAVNGGAIIFFKETPGCVTLGKYIFVSSKASRNTILHELGHTKQSLMLGPLYLVIIGVPSILWAALHKYIAPDKSYYDFYTESWANKLDMSEMM